ncbi:alpha-glucosidase/alpha-galactosidase [Paenibacillus sacheonensis]|uniref:Alpha-galactosidase n=1 Tax=Paenibacillus sacheonensis TaxID=742054 RepID=A0A7X4YQU5_9BACL|nr:alpha-glucosidase/alpha-galactosidase [Paenibacillus sacheonensis]MBM7567219.1 alpha-galactosidase [Paenibacillus sacheonensis]NBC70856.1 alpha-galactosidase [Paenibacillus sacheonensis]
MAFKIAFVGAGSVGFTRGLLRDLLSVPEFADIEVAFTDINESQLDMVTQLCQRDIRENGLAIDIQSTLDRREALAGAKYVFTVVRIGGLEAFASDIDIPLRYGVDQCVGDTLCTGGLMYAQRGIAEMLNICKDIREVAHPDCLLLNYANPMAMLTWACNKYGGVRTVGLCHGVQGDTRQVAEVLGLGKEDIDVVCAGINHQTWFVSVKHRGEDMTGKLLEAFENHPVYRDTEKVRIDLLRRFGYFSTESNGHDSEYVPWYRKRPDDIGNWIDLSVWINGETGGYLRVCTEGRDWFKTDFPNWLAAPPFRYAPEERGEEHGSYIIEGLETGRVYRGHFNVPNNGIITNLPDDAIIEAPGYVDRNGIGMPVVGDIPLGCAAVCNASISVQRLGVEAAVRGDDLLLRQAMLMDPLTGAVCNPPEVWQMADELLVAQERWLPQYGTAIAEAKERLASGKKVPTRDGYRGAARLKTKTVEEQKADREAANRNAGEADKAKEKKAAAGQG